MSGASSFFCIVLREQKFFHRISGDDTWMVPPVPIPNTVVKHSEAESTCLVTGWEDRKLPVGAEEAHISSDDA